MAPWNGPNNSKRPIVATDMQHDRIFNSMQPIQGAPIINNSLEKMLRFSHSRYAKFDPNFQTLYVSILATYAVTFVEITNVN